LSGVLAGVKILELSHFVAGPFCGQILGDMGAEVTKVERPKIGDAGRSFYATINGESTYYASFNRNKKGITINMKDRRGQKIFRQLAAEADILVENYKPGFLDQIELGYKDLSRVNPKLVMVSISGFGSDGPYKNKPALDMVVQAMSGLMSVNGEPDGMPLRTANVVSDFTTGLYGAISALGALQHQRQTGEGQHVEVAMLDATISIMENFLTNWFMLQRDTPRAGNQRPTTAPGNVYKAQDGMIYIAAQPNAHYTRLCKLMGRTDLMDEELYSSSEKRLQYKNYLDEEIGKWAAQFDIESLESLLDKHGIPNGPVKNIAQVCGDEHLKYRGSFAEIDHPVIGKITVPGIVPRFSKTPGSVRYAPPLLGQHNEEVLAGLGYSKEEIKNLIQTEAI